MGIHNSPLSIPGRRETEHKFLALQQSVFFYDGCVVLGTRSELWKNDKENRKSQPTNIKGFQAREREREREGLDRRLN